MAEIDVEDGLGYPIRGDDALVVHAVGGGVPALLNVLWVVAAFAAVFVEELSLLVFALVPLQFAVGAVWLGYFLRVVDTTLAGATDPPGFGNWGRLVRDGLGGTLITLVYGAPLVAVTVAGYALAFALLLGSEFAQGSVAEATMAAGGVAGMGVMLVTAVGMFALSVVVAYLLPISLVAYADERSVVAAFSPGTLKTVGLSAEYAVPWMIVAAVYFGIYMATSFLTAILVGYLLVPFLPLVYFFLGMAAFRMFARGYAEKVEPADAATTDGTVAGRSRPPEDV